MSFKKLAEVRDKSHIA